MLFVLLMLLWLGLSGSVQPGDVLTGAVISALLQLFSRRYLPRRTYHLSLRRILVLAEYVLYLVREIFFSCLGMMRLVWFRREIA
ncbi:MAG: Na+/H+ antiporter subunit E, partial [Oscillospiraceae bacterium]|nr:Na+/H+ antiporter subunit E [Oscillospiraceae bacterium]